MASPRNTHNTSQAWMVDGSTSLSANSMQRVPLMAYTSPGAAQSSLSTSSARRRSSSPTSPTMGTQMLTRPRRNENTPSPFPPLEQLYCVESTPRGKSSKPSPSPSSQPRTSSSTTGLNQKYLKRAPRVRKDTTTSTDSARSSSLLREQSSHSTQMSRSSSSLVNGRRSPGNTIPRMPSLSASLLSSRSFISEASSIICRICHEGESREELMAPCKCAGTMGLIHTTCIEKWLSLANSDRCEICGWEYITERRPRPFHQWFFSPPRPSDKRNLYGDMACFVLLTPLAAVSAWLCMSGAMHYSEFKDTKWETVGLITLSVFLLLIYVVWCSVALRYHVRIYREWQQRNQEVKIISVPPGDMDENNNEMQVINVSSLSDYHPPVHSSTASCAINIPQDNPATSAATSATSAATNAATCASSAATSGEKTPDFVDVPLAASSPLQLFGQDIGSLLEELREQEGRDSHSDSSSDSSNAVISIPFRETYV